MPFHERLIRSHPILILFILSSFPWLFSLYQSSPWPGSLDAFIYTGHFLNSDLILNQLSTEAYYFSRISWILIGDLCYVVLDENVAGLVLRLLLSFALSAGLYKILRLSRSAPEYILPIIVLATLPVWNPEVGMALLWDYPDGPAICYAVWGCYFLLNHRMKEVPRIVIACVLFVLAGCANLIVGFVIAAYLIGYMVVYRPHPANYSIGIYLGFVLGNLLLIFLGKVFYGGTHIYLNQFKQVSVVMNDPTYLVNMWGHGYGFLIEHNKYGMFALILMISSIVLHRFIRKQNGERRFVTLFYLAFVISLLSHVVADLVFDRAILRVHKHVSYVLLPAHLLAAGILLEIFTAHRNEKHAGNALWLIVLAGATALLAGTERIQSVIGISASTNWFLLGLWSIICVRLSFSWVRYKKTAIIMISLLPAFFSLLQQSRAGFSVFNKENAACMKTIIEVSSILFAHQIKEPLAIVYDEEGDPLRLFDSIASACIGWNDPRETFRRFLQNSGDNGDMYIRGKVLHLASSPDRLADHLRKFQERGFKSQVVLAGTLDWHKSPVWYSLVKYSKFPGGYTRTVRQVRTDLGIKVSPGDSRLILILNGRNLNLLDTSRRHNAKVLFSQQAVAPVIPRGPQAGKASRKSTILFKLVDLCFNKLKSHVIVF